MISIVLNCDTRPGSAAEFQKIHDPGGGNLYGVHALDFLTDGVINRNRFFAGHERETILYVDVHEPIPADVMRRIDELREAGEITKFATVPHSKARHRWNNHLYLDAFRLCSPDAEFIAHFDGDTPAFKREDYDAAAGCIAELDKGYKFCCSQSKLTPVEHRMKHASTRFFFCRKRDLDVEELSRLLDDSYRQSRFPGQHFPHLEDIIGATAGPNGVTYPMRKLDDYLIFSWVNYYAGSLAKLNESPYSFVREYVRACGDMHGPEDLVGLPIPWDENPPSPTVHGGVYKETDSVKPARILVNGVDVTPICTKANNLQGWADVRPWAGGPSIPYSPGLSVDESRSVELRGHIEYHWEGGDVEPMAEWLHGVPRQCGY